MFFSFLLQLKFHNFIYPTTEKTYYVVRWLNWLKRPPRIPLIDSSCHGQIIGKTWNSSVLDVRLRSSSVLLV